MKTVPIVVIMELCRKGGTNLYPINRETLVFISKAVPASDSPGSSRPRVRIRASFGMTKLLSC